VQKNSIITHSSTQHHPISSSDVPRTSTFTEENQVSQHFSDISILQIS